MSKLNSLRLVNLNYNNNTMKVNDEIFQFGGESTLMNLRNGGGKSVMVQMMMAPFVTKRNRDLKERKFNSYFTSPTPTFILTEWVLEGGDNHVLIGMAVRKKNSTEEDDEELDIINFIHEYRGSNPYDIYNLPVVENQGNTLKIKSFGNFKTFVEELKKNRDFNFNYYDMNVASQSRNYFETLKQYKINHKEWESIIRKVNMKESGLSELFQEAKSIPGLVEKWFIKTVEDKLNREENKISNFQEIIKKFIYQFKENEARVQKKAAIELFKEESETITLAADSFNKERIHKEEIENEIANLISFLKTSKEARDLEQESLREFLNSLKAELKDIQYEEASVGFYKLMDEIEALEEEINNTSLQIEKVEGEKLHLERTKGVYQCAKIYEDYKKTSQRVQKYENQLELANSNQEETEEERKHIGFTLKNYYLKEEDTLENQLKDNMESLDKTKEEIETIASNLKDFDAFIFSNSKRLGGLQSDIKRYNEVEEKFNDKYKKKILRNMLGFYPEDLILTCKNAYEKQETVLKEKIKNLNKTLVLRKEEVPKVESEKGRLSSLINKINMKLEEGEKQKIEIEEKIKERKDVLKYIEFPEEKLYQTEEILKTFESKIELLREEEKTLLGRVLKVKEELTILETGRNLKLSKELERKLKGRGIDLVYGVDWLKNNSYTMEENFRLIDKNPMLPYSLIMEDEDINKLKSEELGVYSNSPIPIINRRNLDKNLGKINKELWVLEDITFYISFNHKLLNEEELRILLAKKEEEIRKAEELLNLKRKDIDTYQGLRNNIKTSTLHKDSYKNLLNEIEKDEKELKAALSQSEHMNEKLEELKSSIEKGEKQIKEEEKLQRDLKDEMDSFKELALQYEKYKNYKIEAEKVSKTISEADELKAQKEEDIKQKRNYLKSLEEQKRELSSNLSKIKEQVSRFLQYEQGTIIEKDIEDLQGRYLALTSELMKEIKVIEEELKEARESFRERETELTTTQDEYGLLEEDFRQVFYDRTKENEVKKQLKEAKRTFDKLKEAEIEKKIELAGLEERKRGIIISLEENYGRAYPKERGEIIFVNFPERILEKNEEIQRADTRLKVNIKEQEIIGKTLSSLDSYGDLSVTQFIEISTPIKSIERFKGELVRDYNQCIDRNMKERNNLSDEITKVSKIHIFSDDDFFMRTLSTLAEIVDEPQNVIETLDTALKAQEMILMQLYKDLELINEERANVEDILFDYVLEVHENLDKIHDNSTIKIKDKYVKMLQIKLPDWESNKELYRIRLRDLVNGVTEKGLALLTENQNIEEMLSKTITTVNLYNEVVSISNVDVKLYKVEEDRQIPISWNEVSKNSGGEGFLSAFVILSSLLSYMRKDDSEIFSTSGEGKVLIMDNPFAQTSSEHLLKPLMDIAKKSNTQLICFTGLGGDSILNRFDNVYVLDLKASKLRNGTQKYLVSTHEKGEELVHDLISSRFKIKEEEVEQMELF